MPFFYKFTSQCSQIILDYIGFEFQIFFLIDYQKDLSYLGKTVLHHAIDHKQLDMCKLFLGVNSDSGSMGVVLGRRGIYSISNPIFKRKKRRRVSFVLDAVRVFERQPARNILFG